MIIKFYYPFLSPPFFIFIFLVRLVTPMLKLVYRSDCKMVILNYWACSVVNSALIGSLI